MRVEKRERERGGGERERGFVDFHSDRPKNVPYSLRLPLPRDTVVDFNFTCLMYVAQVVLFVFHKLAPFCLCAEITSFL